MRVLLPVALAMLFAQPASARWVRVETDRFVLYSDSSEAVARESAGRLMTFDAVLRVFHPATLKRPPGTKLQVFLLASQGDVRRVRPKLSSAVAGFYAPSDEGVIAVATRGGLVGKDDNLFHEYGHHFMYDNFPAAYPGWFVEGWAEYFSTADIRPEGVRVGGYNPGRVAAIGYFGWLPLEKVLTTAQSDLRGNDRFVYYAQAWFLTHYMSSDPGRAKQLDAAILAISKGEDPVKSFETATGHSIDELSRSVKKHTSLPVFLVKVQEPAPPMSVTAMPPSADDLLLDKARLLLTSPGERNDAYLASIRKKAAKYPGDMLAEQVLAKAEFIYGDVSAGEAIMQRRLAQGETFEDLLLASTGQVIAGLRRPDERLERFRAGRALVARAFKINADDYRVLYLYAYARSVEAGYPTDNDVSAWLRTYDLAPSVEISALRAGMVLLKKDRRAEAEPILKRVANNPHGGAAARVARNLLSSGLTDPTQLGLLTLPDGEDDEPTQPPQPPEPGKEPQPAK
jgi:hypothetical protein